jgi:peptidoglycan L-alanyl-D-glutamate endopeptidase CwlK
MTYKFSKSSLERLKEVDMQLILLANEVIKITKIDFSIIWGKRTLEEQQVCFINKKSNCDGVKKISKHQQGKAIDIMCYDEKGKGTWDVIYYRYINELFKQVAKELNISYKWGGDFVSFCDAGHFEV